MGCGVVWCGVWGFLTLLFDVPSFPFLSFPWFGRRAGWLESYYACADYIDFSVRCRYRFATKHQVESSRIESQVSVAFFFGRTECGTLVEIIASASAGEIVIFFACGKIVNRVVERATWMDGWMFLVKGVVAVFGCRCCCEERSRVEVYARLGRFDGTSEVVVVVVVVVVVSDSSI